MSYNPDEGEEYRKTATVKVRFATEDGTIDTLEGVHTYSKGDAIAGPGAAGEYWPIRRDIFEQTYALVEE